ARVQDGEDDLDRGPAVLRARDRLDGDPSAVIGDGDRVVLVQRDDDPVAEPGHGFVDRVVDNLVHEVMQTARAGRAYVHARPFADWLEAFQDLDVAGVVA